MHARDVASLLAALAVCAPSAALAQQDAPADEVPVLENFSPLELGLTGAAFLGMGFYLFVADEVLPSPTPSMGVPEPGSIAWPSTHCADPNPTPEQWLRGVPDRGTYIVPALVLGTYAPGGIGHAFSDDFPLPDTTHEALAFTQALSWTQVTINTLKYVAGRRRPFTVREDVDTQAIDDDEADYNLSFPSGHSATAAVTTVFLALDFGDYLLKGPLDGANEPVRFMVGRALPLAAAGGLTWTVMYSRIKDQRHWLSDTLTGAFIGGAFATAFYVLHFDEDGDPRRRFPSEEASDDAPVAIFAPAITPNGDMHLSYGFVW